MEERLKEGLAELEIVRQNIRKALLHRKCTAIDIISLELLGLLGKIIK